MSGVLAGAMPEASSSTKATARSAKRTRRGKAQMRSVKFMGRECHDDLDDARRARDGWARWNVSVRAYASKASLGRRCCSTLHAPATRRAGVVAAAFGDTRALYSEF